MEAGQNTQRRRSSRNFVIPKRKAAAARTPAPLDDSDQENSVQLLDLDDDWAPTAKTKKQEVKKVKVIVKETKGKKRKSVSTPKAKPPKKVAKKEQVRKAGGSDKLVSEALECIICLDFAASPIHNCTNGHITCGICTQKLPTKNCSMCKAKLTVSVFGERLAKQLEHKLKCDNYEEGCKELIKSTDMKKHVKQCPYRPVSCSLAPCTGGNVTFSSYVNHLKTTHNLKVEEGPTFMWFIHLIRLKKEDAGKNFVYEPVLMSWKNKLFIRRGYRNRDTLYMWAELVGSPEDADKYRFGVEAISRTAAKTKNARVSFRMPVFPIHSEFGLKKPSPLFAAFPVSTLVALGAESGNGVKEIGGLTSNSPLVTCRFDASIRLA